MTAVVSEYFWNSSGPVQRTTALIVLIGMVAVIGSALGFEYIGGYAPCALCLEQRIPYYWGIPIIALGVVSALANWPACLTRGTLVIAFLCLIATALLGGYHAGVEWGFWPGPESCGAGFSTTSSDAGSLLESLSNSKPPSCEDAAGRFLGISFAGWNVLAALTLAVVAYRGAFGSTHR